MRDDARLGAEASAFVTDMSQPMGRAAGNALEVVESAETLRGEGPEDVRELTLELAARMIVLAGVEQTDAIAVDRARKAPRERSRMGAIPPDGPGSGRRPLHPGAIPGDTGSRSLRARAALRSALHQLSTIGARLRSHSGHRLIPSELAAQLGAQVAAAAADVKILRDGLSCP